MNKKQIMILVVCTACMCLAAICSALAVSRSDNTMTPQQTDPKSPDQACYIIDNQKICLVNGSHQVEAAPGSASQIKTSIFGQPFYGDLNGDGFEDSVVFIVQDTGGSGIFYYVAAAIKLNGEYTGTNAIFLGDRIKPKQINIQESVITVYYDDRKFDETMTVSPSVGVIKHIILNGNELFEKVSF